MLSVIVPTYNRVECLRQCLGAIRQSAFTDYELIVVVDGGEVGAEVAESFGARTIRHAQSMGPTAARRSGIEASQGSALVFVDSDVVIKSDTLGHIHQYFEANSDVDALTGMLAVEHPHPNLFSQYKNLYMHYIFSLLPDRVSFLYGSIHAVRRSSIGVYQTLARVGEDTEIGQQLVKAGKCISFLRELQVVHLKHYTAYAFFRNDFSVPFHWAGLFIVYKGWRQIGRAQTGFAHSPKEQLIAITLIALFLLAICANLLIGVSLMLALLAAAAWCYINLRFFRFLHRQRGGLFLLFSIPITFLDQTVMGFGIAAGLSMHLPYLGKSKVGKMV